jgi:hypothetical protein
VREPNWVVVPAVGDAWVIVAAEAAGATVIVAATTSVATPAHVMALVAGPLVLMQAT